MPDLSTTYLGLKLKNPLVASASPFPKKLDNIQRMEAAGLSAIVLHSLFEEQITFESNELDHFLSAGTEILRRSPDLLSGPAKIQPGARTVPRPDPQGARVGAHPDHRLAQRNFHRRLGELRPLDRTGGGQRARIERVLPARPIRT